jgi:hypothetical protein
MVPRPRNIRQLWPMNTIGGGKLTGTAKVKRDENWNRLRM